MDKVRSTVVRRRLLRSFFERDTLVVARELLGCELCHHTPEGEVSGIIVEAEGYLGGDDLASHARFGPKGRSAVMFGPPGTAYVYLIYGMYHLFNTVTEPEGKPGGVLVRAVEPLSGIAIMKRNRGDRGNDRLATGPGLLSRAFGIASGHNRSSLEDGPIGIYAGERIHDSEVALTPRIGVTGSKEHPYRFIIKESPYVSGPKSRRKS